MKQEQVKRYRRRSDGQIVEAMQYTHEDTSASIAAFVLRLNVDAHVTVANERILDVVQPIFGEWDRKAGRFPLRVIDPTTGLGFKLDIGGWVVRAGNSLLFPKDFHAGFVELPPESEQSDFDILSDIIYDAFPQDMEGETYQALAESAATAVIRAGWSRKE